jgi:gliding motility-associated-like protein
MLARYTACFYFCMMNSKGKIFILLILFPYTIFCQNLVINPSFEDHNSCPNTAGQICFADFWFQPSTEFFPCPAPTSSDYYNDCATFWYADVPDNVAGSESARTGSAYAGIDFIQTTNSGFEYIEVGLLAPLDSGKRYCSGYFISRAGVVSKYACDRQAAYFTTDSLLYNGGGTFVPIIVTPQIENTGGVVYDTSGWVLIEGMFVAVGGEKFMTIGNFSPSLTSLIQTTSSATYGAYYYVDDVFLDEMVFDKADAGSDKIICIGDSVQIGATAQCDGCTYSWTPATGLNDAAVAQPFAFPLQTTTYFFTLTDTTTADSCSCKSLSITTDSITIYVDPPCPPPPQPEQPIEIYNVFTPNGDTKNDFFAIKNLPANSALQIFNRWGSRIYENSNYNNKWDGDDVPDGTYYYILVLPTKENYHGFVEIRR